MAVLDKKDRAILDSLKKDSRASIRDISRSTRIRPSTVHKRLQDLKRRGVIERFTVKLDNSAIGEDFIVFMFLCTSQDLPKPFFNDNRIKEAFGITGEYDLLLKLKFAGINDFNDYIINLRKNKAIAKTLTTVVTIPIKEEI